MIIKENKKKNMSILIKDILCDPKYWLTMKDRINKYDRKDEKTFSTEKNK